LAFVAAALVDVRPDGAKLRVACFELDAAVFFAGAFFFAVVELHRDEIQHRLLAAGKPTLELLPYSSFCLWEVRRRRHHRRFPQYHPSLSQSAPVQRLERRLQYENIRNLTKTAAFLPRPLAGAFFEGAAGFLFAAVFLGAGSSESGPSKSEAAASMSIAIESSEATSDSSSFALPLPLPCKDD
jgi:hypothetical protein